MQRRWGRGGIRTSGVAASVADKVHIGTLQLLGIAVAAHGDHAPPKGLGLLVDEVRQAGVDVARGDAVDAGKVSPLVGQRLGQVDAAGLRDVVRGLLLREVDNVAGHGRRDHEGAVALLLEVRSDRLGAVRGAVEVRLDDSVPVLGAAV